MTGKSATTDLGEVGVPVGSAFAGKEVGATSSIAAIERLQMGLNSAFEFVAVELPRLSTDLDIVASFLAGSVDNQPRTNADAWKATKGSLSTELNRATAWLLHSQVQLENILAELRPGVDRLLLALTEVRREARELRVLALNASFVAQQGGDGMGGFVAATSELIGIAAEQLVGAEQVIDVVERVGSSFECLEAIGREFTEQVAAIEAVSADVALTGVIQALSAIELQLDEVTNQCRTVSQNVARLMIAIQRQDILRQGLDHVGLVAREIEVANRTLLAYREGHGSAEEALQSAELVRQGAALCANLLENILAELAEFLGEIDGQLRLLVSLSDMVAKGSHGDPAGELRERVEVLHGAVLLLAEHLHRRTESQAKKSRILSELCTVVAPLPSRLRLFADRQDQVRTLGILVRRQDAHFARGLMGAAAIVEALQGLLRDNGATWVTTLQDAAHIRRRTREFERLGGDASVGTDDGLLRDLSDLDEVIARSTRHAETVSEQARRAVEATCASANRMLARLTELQLELGSHHELVASYRLRSNFGANFIEKLATSSSTQIALPARLASLIEKFTILSHKHLATQTVVWESTPEPAGGSITLF